LSCRSRPAARSTIGLYTRFQNGLFVNPAVAASSTAELVELAQRAGIQSSN